MPKVISKEAIKNGCSQIAETKNGYFMYNNYYNNNLKSYPFATTSASGSSEQIQTRMNSILRIPSGLDMNLKGKVLQTFKPLIVTDNNNPSIFYSIYNNFTAKKDGVTVIKYTESEEMGINIIKTSISTSGEYTHPHVILAQTNKYILIGAVTNATGSMTNVYLSVLRYNKVTGEFTVLYTSPITFRLMEVSPLISNETEAYFFYHISDTCYLYGIDVESGVFTLALTLDNKSYTSHFYDFVKKIDKNKVEFIHLYFEPLKPILFKKIELDISQTTSANKVKISDITVTYNSTFTSANMMGNSTIGLLYHTFENTSSNGNIYYNIAIYTINHTYDGKEFEGIYTYKKNADGSLEAKGFTIFSNSYYTTGLLLSEDKSWFITGSEYEVSSYFFDEVQEKFIKKNDFNMQNPISMGLDKNEKIWVIDGAYKLHCFSNAIAKDVELTLDKRSYNYEGSEIQGTVSIICKNYEGDAISSNLILDINGPAMFIDNNLKSINVSVTEEQPLVVPIIITGPGDFTVSSKIIL